MIFGSLTLSFQHPACKNRVVGCWRGYLMPLPLTVSCFSKIQIGLPFWYQLTRIVLNKGPFNGCVFFQYFSVFQLLAPD